MNRCGWVQCLDRFTRKNAGRGVVIEADLRETGAMPAAANSPLSGIVYDRRDNAVQIMLGGTAVDVPHRTIVVRDVLALDSLVTPTGRDVALRIAIPTGQIIVTFVPAKDGERELR